MAEENKEKETKVEENKETEDSSTKEKKSKSAIEKIKEIGKDKKKEVKIELEREYIVPLRKRMSTVPRYRRAKKAIRVLKEFIAKHMKVEKRDLNKVKIDRFLNNEIWFRGIKNPPAKIKVKAMKDSEGIVKVELVDIPDKVKFAMEWEKKRTEKAKPAKKKAATEEKKEETEEEKKEEKEKGMAVAEAGLKAQKAQAKQAKHTAIGKHEKTTAPVRKALKK